MKKQFLLLKILASLIPGLLAAVPVMAETYSIDPVHSTIGFSVGHLVVSQTRGVFDTYEGSIYFDPQDLASSRINVVIEAKSINTRNEARDEHLRNEDFFDVANHDSLRFTSRNIRKSGGGYEILGDLTIRGTTRPVVLQAQIKGPVNNPFGGQVLGLSARVKINRQDFGVSWNKEMDQGGWVISNEVEIEVEVEAKTQDD